MPQYSIFTDASSNPKLKIGIGATLILPTEIINSSINSINKDYFYKLIRFRKFENASSTKLEIETALWALGMFKSELGDSYIESLKLYTDSQCVAGLLDRRARLEQNNFIAQSSNIELHNAELYKQFYILYDQLQFETIKVKGHSKSSLHDSIHRIFSFIDKESRRELKSWVEETQK